MQVLVIGTGMQDAADLAWWQPMPPASPQGSPHGKASSSKQGMHTSSKAGAGSSSTSPQHSPAEGADAVHVSTGRSHSNAAHVMVDTLFLVSLLIDLVILASFHLSGNSRIRLFVTISFCQLMSGRICPDPKSS